MRVVEANSEMGANGGDGRLAADARPLGKPAADDSMDGKSAADDSGWFSEMARALHPDKPGTILHLVTGLGDERLCQRYAAEKDPVQPKAYFLRALLRNPNGWTYLAAVMDGCNADWWRDLQDARDLLQPVIAKIRHRLNAKEGQSDGRRKNNSR